MRRTIFLSIPLFVGTLGIAVACSEQEPASPTAPGARGVGIRASQDVATAPIPGAAKPVPAPTGFTQVTTVTAGPLQIAAGAFGGLTAICPAGTTVVSGGHEFTGYSVMVPPWVRISRAVPTGWSVAVHNQVAGASAAALYVYANCAS